MNFNAAVWRVVEAKVKELVEKTVAAAIEQMLAEGAAAQSEETGDQTGEA